MPDPDGLAEAALIRAWLRCAAASVHERRVWLTDLDAAIGDGDHGINLDRGFTAVLADLDGAGDRADPAAAVLTAAGRRLLGMVGGASGALYGRGLMTAGRHVGERPEAGPSDPVRLASTILGGAVEGITALGHAAAGDKTMLDALLPALSVLRSAASDADPASTLAAAAAAGEAGAAATVPLVARKGRASYLGERSAGHLDPGAASAALLLRCLATTLADTPA